MTETRVRRAIAISAFAGAALLATGSPAGAADGCSDSSASTPDCTVEVKPVVINAPDPSSGTDLPTKANPQVLPSQQQLPVTGSEATTLVATGLALTAAGFVLVRRSSASTTAKQQ